MPVTTFRIDDRLVHGQIMHAWLKESGADTILVADDAVAGDTTQQLFLKLVVPQSVRLFMKSIKDAAQAIKDGVNSNVILLVRDPQSALTLLNEGVELNEINLGNISNSASESPRKRLLKNIFANQNDVDCLREIAKKGVNVTIRLLPTDAPINALELIEKNY